MEAARAGAVDQGILAPLDELAQSVLGPASVLGQRGPEGGCALSGGGAARRPPVELRQVVLRGARHELEDGFDLGSVGEAGGGVHATILARAVGQTGRPWYAAPSRRAIASTRPTASKVQRDGRAGRQTRETVYLSAGAGVRGRKEIRFPP